MLQLEFDPMKVPDQWGNYPWKAYLPVDGYPDLQVFLNDQRFREVVTWTNHTDFLDPYGYVADGFPVQPDLVEVKLPGGQVLTGVLWGAHRTPYWVFLHLQLGEQTWLLYLDPDTDVPGLGIIEGGRPPITDGSSCYLWEMEHRVPLDQAFRQVRNLSLPQFEETRIYVSFFGEVTCLLQDLPTLQSTLLNTNTRHLNHLEVHYGRPLWVERQGPVVNHTGWWVLPLRARGNFHDLAFLLLGEYVNTNASGQWKREHFRLQRPGSELLELDSRGILDTDTYVVHEVESGQHLYLLPGEEFYLGEAAERLVRDLSWYDFTYR